MSGILSFLSDLGLVDLEKEKLFETEEDIKSRRMATETKVVSKVEEKDLLYDRFITCPVCEKKFATKVMKTGKTKFLSSDLDLRPQYDGIDSVKYDAITCEHCGYSVLSKFFAPLSRTQIQSVYEKVISKITVNACKEEFYSYDVALERMQYTLACAMAKRTKNSEKAYICLKTAWLYRGQRMELEEKKQLLPQKREELISKEQEYLKSALDGFLLARSMETFPVCGMDVATFDYLVAAIAFEIDRTDIATKLVSELLTKQSVNNRIKEKARNLKEEMRIKEKKTEST